MARYWVFIKMRIQTYMTAICDGPQLEIKRCKERGNNPKIGASAANVFITALCYETKISFPDFFNGSKIYPDIRSGYNSKEIVEKSLNPAPKLIEKRIKEFTDTAGIKSALKGTRCVTPGTVYYLLRNNGKD